MRTNIHIALGCVILIGLMMAGVEAVKNPVGILIFLLSITIPDIDLAVGAEYHRRHSHSIFFGALYALFVALMAFWVSAVLNLPFVIIVAGIITVIHFLNCYKESGGDLESTVVHYLWIVFVAGWFIIDLTDFTLPRLGLEQTFFVAFTGYIAHLAGDFLNADKKKLEILAPFSSKKFGTEKAIIKTESAGEAAFFAVLVSTVAAVLMIFGRITSTIFKSFGPSLYPLLVFVGTVATGLAVFFSTKPKKKEKALLVLRPPLVPPRFPHIVVLYPAAF